MCSEQEKLEIVIEGLRNGEVFIENGRAVDEWGDPIFEEDETNED